MENSSNCELTQIKDEPNVCKKEPLGRCDDLVNEFVDYTMVSVPLSATDMSEMDTTAFIDSISQSTSKQAEKGKQTDSSPADCAASMEVDEEADVRIPTPIEDNTEPTSVLETIPNTCDTSTTPASVDPSSSPPITSEVSKEANSKDDVVMLSDSEDEDKTKTDPPVAEMETETIEETPNKEVTAEVVDAALDNEKVQTDTNSANVVEAENNETEHDSSVIMLDDSPENSEAEVQSNNDSSKPNGTDVNGEYNFPFIWCFRCLTFCHC